MRKKNKNNTPPSPVDALGFVYDCRADSHYTALHLSEGFETVTGFAANQVLNNQQRTLASMIHPSDLPMVDDEVETAIELHQSWVVEYRMRTADGRYRWVRETGQAVLSPTGVVRHLSGWIVPMDRPFEFMRVAGRSPRAQRPQDTMSL
jgi:PAS domain S-box-containing protein